MPYLISHHYSLLEIYLVGELLETADYFPQTYPVEVDGNWNVYTSILLSYYLRAAGRSGNSP